MNFTFNASQLELQGDIYATEIIADYDLLGGVCDGLEIGFLNILLRFLAVYLVVEFVLCYTKYYERAYYIMHKISIFMYVYIGYYYMSFRFPDVLTKIGQFQSIVWVLLVIMFGFLIYKIWRDKDSNLLRKFSSHKK